MSGGNFRVSPVSEPLSKDDVFELARRGELSAGHLIPGHQFTEPSMEIRTPIDNTLIGYMAAGTSSDVAQAVVVAREAFDSGEWSRISPAERKRIMLAWAELIRRHAEEIAALVVYLASDESSYTTGVAHAIDGGWTNI